MYDALLLFAFFCIALYFDNVERLNPNSVKVELYGSGSLWKMKYSTVTVVAGSYQKLYL